MGEIVEMGSFKYLGQDDRLHNIHFGRDSWIIKKAKVIRANAPGLALFSRLVFD